MGGHKITITVAPGADSDLLPKEEIKTSTDINLKDISLAYPGTANKALTKAGLNEEEAKKVTKGPIQNILDTIEENGLNLEKHCICHPGGGLNGKTSLGYSTHIVCPACSSK